MDKVYPAIRRRYCVCGRICGDTTQKVENAADNGVRGASHEPSSSSVSSVQTEKSAPPCMPSNRQSSPPPPPPSDTLTLLQLKVRALEKYKTNYELLCSQLAELNTQVGLQLQRHEVDVTTLHATITTLQTTNASLQQDLDSTQQQLQRLTTVSENDRAYATNVHNQLTTVAALLQTAEQRLKDQDTEAQRESAAHQQTKADVTRLTTIQQTLETEVHSLRAQIATVADSEKLRRKHRTEIKHLTLELEQLREELEQQRAMTRQAKKLLKQTRDERETLAKQLASIQLDGTQLTAILEAQRDEMARQDKKTQRWKKQFYDCDATLSETLQSLEDTESLLACVQEELVAKNARVEQLMVEMIDRKEQVETAQNEAKAVQLERRTLQTQLEHVQQEYEAFKVLQTETAVRKEETTTKEMQRRYHKELAHMKQLLSLNQQRTTESSHEMQVLKQELGSVQLLLRKCHRHKQSTRRHNDLTSSSTSSSNIDHARRRYPRADVEKAVLQSAIMDQVNEAW